MKNYITEKVIPIKFLPVHLDRIILDCIFLLTSPLQYCTHAIFKTAYYSLVHPHMSYGVRFWGNSSKNKILSIFVLQVSCKNSLPSRLWKLLWIWVWKFQIDTLLRHFVTFTLYFNPKHFVIPRDNQSVQLLANEANEVYN